MKWVFCLLPTCERVLGEGRAKAGVAKALRQGSVIAVVQVLEEQQVLLLEVAQFPPGGVGVRVGRGLAAAGVRATGAVEAVAVGAVRVLQDLAQANASAVARILVEGGRAGSSVILVRGGLGRKGESRERERVPQGSPLGGGALRACASQPWGILQRRKRALTSSEENVGWTKGNYCKVPSSLTLCLYLDIFYIWPNVIEIWKCFTSCTRMMAKFRLINSNYFYWMIKHINNMQ